ncbi:MAG: transposase family protein [Gammaproteobacteria bacterium]|nr:transposase family protein [Gammaproteobacteria bacterium]
MIKLEELKTIDQLSQFLDGTQAVIFKLDTIKKKRYQWIQHELVRFDYMRISKANKGIVKRYLVKVSSYSRAQVTRLIKQYNSNGFKGKYTSDDIRLIARMNERHDTPCGQAIKKLMERAYGVFGEQEYRRLSTISVSHLYNLRQSKIYSKTRTHFEKTRPKKSTIGERRKPQPNGKPGYIRIDTVHQGDQDKVKGIYHINAVDEVTQFEIVCSVEKISEAYLLPVLKTLLDFFPFTLISFHSDNGSEYINQHVARLLKKLLIEFTKSRSRHSNDNALAESKNASVVRKILGYHHIPQKYASLVNDFNQAYLNPHINYHRPCFFPEIITDAKSYLKDGISFNKMDDHPLADH